MGISLGPALPVAGSSSFTSSLRYWNKPGPALGGSLSHLLSSFTSHSPALSACWGLPRGWADHSSRVHLVDLQSRWRGRATVLGLQFGINQKDPPWEVLGAVQKPGWNFPSLWASFSLRASLESSPREEERKWYDTKQALCRVPDNNLTG